MAAEERMMIMKALSTLVLAASIAAPALAHEAGTSQGAANPALSAYMRDVVEGQLWKRTELGPRDRSLVTISALIARGYGASLDAELERALANGVKPAEISETVLHLAFYAGLSSANNAAPAVERVFAARGISTDSLPCREVDFLSQDVEGEAARVAAVAGLLGDASPGLADFTTEPLFSEIWLRPDLAPRDRSLVTITSLIALGQTGQLAGHLNRALNNGVTPAEAGEVVAHLAFYSDWPTAFSAGPVLRDVLDKRAE
jgi:4-carboxymuconolactone decarboxylase